MSQYTSFDTVGKKEDVSDVISNISPTKTPFSTMTSKETVNNTLYQWQEDSLRAPAENAQPQGFTATPTARTPTVMRSNVTQIMQDTFNVSGTLESVSHYGRAKESAYQLAKTAAELKRDLEHAFVGTGQTKVEPANKDQPGKFAGVQAQIDSTMYVYTGGSGTAPTEANYLDALEAVFDEGAEPGITMVTPTNSRVFADFAAASGRRREIGGGKKIVNAVDLYVSPFGEQRIVINRFVKTGDTLILDMPMWKRVVLKGRDWFRETLAKTGDNTTFMLVGEFGLKHKNYKAGAVIRQAVAP